MMKKEFATRILSSAAAGLAFLSFAGEAPDFAETTVIDAPEGQTVSAGDLTVGDRGKVYKTGAGVLAVEANRLARPTDGRRQPDRQPRLREWRLLRLDGL